MMDKQTMLNGLQEAQELLSDRVPVIFAWDAIKAVKAALNVLGDIEMEGYENAETV